MLTNEQNARRKKGQTRNGYNVTPATPGTEYRTVCRNPVSRIRQIVPTLPSLPKKTRQTVPRIRQIGFRQTGHIPPNMGQFAETQFAETQFAEFGKLSLPCPVCGKKIRQTVPRIRQIGFRQLGIYPGATTNALVWNSKSSPFLRKLIYFFFDVFHVTKRKTYLKHREKF